MALTSQQIAAFKHELEDCARPLFFFDDDADGLCSFLLLYRYKRKGHGVIVKSLPELQPTYLNKVNEYQPDKVFVLDKPKISDAFIQGVHVPIIMLDHHEPILNREKIKYFNPRLNNDKDNRPTSYWCYQIVQQDIWIACVGCVSDWYAPDFLPQLKNDYSDIFPKQRSAKTILFNSKLGHLCKMFSFFQKGPTKEVMLCIKILTRVQTPYEIIDGSTAAGKFLLQKFEMINKQYDELLRSVKPTREPVLIFTYAADKMSFTSDISNELLYLYPKKVILVCRERNGEMRCSVRSTHAELPSKIQRAMQGLKGYGGGHTNACGVCVAVDDFPIFLDRFKAELKTSQEHSL